MKLRNLNILLLLSALTLLPGLSSCVDDYLYNSVKGSLKPGTPVEISFGLQVPEADEALVGSSRASTATETDRIVYDLYLFIFNEETQQLKSKYYFAQVSSQTDIACDPTYSTSGSAVIKRTGTGRGLIQHVHTTAGPSKIVGVANCNRKGSAMILDKLNKITTFGELRDVMVSTVDPSSKQPDFEQSLTVMSGYYYDGEEADHVTTPCDFESDEEANGKKGFVNIASEELTGTLWLTPLQSRVKFLVLSECPEGTAEIPAGKFELNSWQVYNLPGRTTLFCRGYGDHTEPVAPRPVNSIAITRFDSDDEVSHTELPATETFNQIFGFNFFTADNHPGKGDPEKILTYGDRAQWTGADMSTFTPPNEKEYLYAPEGATYVVLRGTYSGASYVTDEDGTRTLKNVSGDVSYTIFLGHNSGSGPEADNTDFNTYRNFNYTYIVRVAGVDKITVEVNRDQEDRPDAEGNIITTTSNTVTLDAHYEQRVITIQKQNVIDAINAGDFQVSVTVPLFRVSRRAYKFNAEKPDDDPNNALPYMEWLEFYEHKADEVDRKYIYYTDARGSGATKQTLSVKQFMQRLYDYAHDTNAPDDLTFTVFFDEYLYETDPGTGAESSWRDLLRNGQSRRFTMLGTSKFSDDHNSSYTTSGTTYVQRCMQTIYDVDMAGLERGWGTEVIEEDIFEQGIAGIPHGTFTIMPGYQHNKALKPDSKFGQQNCWRVNCGPDNNLWDFKKLIGIDGYMTKPANPGSNNANETNIISTCLQRNRDLNGNGKIDRDELRWYIPSIEQMQLLYMGYGALTDDVMLYNPQQERQNGNITTTGYKLRHYVSSSNNKKLWSEEGLSYSALGLGVNSPTGTNGWNYDAVLYVRCVRTLGTHNFVHKDVPWNIEDYPQAQYQSIYEYEAYPREVVEIEGEEEFRHKEHKRGRITMRYLNPQALINVPRLTETSDIVHTFSETNYPTFQFEFADTLLAIDGSETPKWQDKRNLETVFQKLKDKENPDFSPCNILGPGWRMPTITELTIMQIAWNDNWDDYIKPDFIHDNAKYNNKWLAFNGFAQSCLLSRTEYYYKLQGANGLQPPHGGGVRTFHVFDKDNTNAQFNLLKKPDETDPYNHRIPTIRCVRSYTTQSYESVSPAPAARASAKRSVRR